MPKAAINPTSNEGNSGESASDVTIEEVDAILLSLTPYFMHKAMVDFWLDIRLDVTNSQQLTANSCGASTSCGALSKKGGAPE